MDEPALAPRNALHGVFIVWGAALVAAVLVGLLVPLTARMPWMLIGFGIMVILSFVAQLLYARVNGFILRVAASAFGALAVMGLVSIGFGIAAVSVAL